MSNITDQKGVASSNPSALKRWVISLLLKRASSDERLTKQRHKLEAKRQREGRRHLVEYFHQVDDGYSHLTIQILAQLKAQYDIDLTIHLVPLVRDANYPEPDLWQEMAKRDAADIAPNYGLSFPTAESIPSEESCQLANQIFCKMDAETFIKRGVEVSEALWRGDLEGLKALAGGLGVLSQDEVQAKLAAGTEYRRQLKHFGSANFYYEGEWYWRVERLYHLENRLISLGASKDKNAPLLAPLQKVPEVFGDGAKNMTLEYFPSLRSPYTAVSWEPTMKLVKDSSINLVIRPVLPMVMRGVPATLEKGLYFWADCKREAKAKGIEFGKFYDPIGKPVMQGYSLYMWAEKQGKGMAVLSSFLKAAFAKGVRTNTMSGIKTVAEMAGLDWNEAKEHLDDDSWQEFLEENRVAMYSTGNWGVPSYRLLDANGNEILSVWGQDRLWLVAQKIIENS